MLAKLPLLLVFSFAALFVNVSAFSAAILSKTSVTLRPSIVIASSSLSSTALFSSPAVLEPPVKEVEKVKENVEDKEASYKKGGWAVRLFNDPMNKREFVAMCLSKIVGLTDGQAYQVMMQAHQNGVAVVGRFDLERAELYRNALCENGLTCDMVPVEED